MDKDDDLYTTGNITDRKFKDKSLQDNLTK